ncbi:MerR family transcriptional regulator [Ignavigranum ruoffiae]
MMLRSQVQEVTGLTRKAIEYYEEKGLIQPTKDANGYRDYSTQDIQQLKKISLYRKLGLSLKDIQTILTGSENRASILRRQQHQVEVDQRRNELLSQLIDGQADEEIEQELALLEKSESIYQRLTHIFPGYFGQAFFAAYQPFFTEELVEDKASAFNRYVAYLDSLPDIDFSDLEISYIEQVTANFDYQVLAEIQADKQAAVEQPEQWLAEHKEEVDTYQAFIQSQDYLTSPLKSIKDKIKQFMLDHKYYEIAIPMIREFSPQYDAYYHKLIKASQVMEEKTNL